MVGFSRVNVLFVYFFFIFLFVLPKNQREITIYYIIAQGKKYRYAAYKLRPRGSDAYGLLWNEKKNT